jgi:hypothetical protein
MITFFTDIRRSALLAFCCTILTIAIPLWNTIRSTMETFSRPELQSWKAPAVIFALLFAAIQPLFYYALYRSPWHLDISEESRLVCLIAAIGFGLLVSIAMIQNAASFDFYNAPLRDLALTLIGDLAGLSYPALLIALRQHEGDSLSGTSTGTFLNGVTKIALVAGGIGIAVAILQLFGAVWAHFSLREQALQNGVTLPPLPPQIVKFSQSALSQACLFTAPWVVYKSQTTANHREPAEQLES